MSTKMRHALLISMTMIALLFASVILSYAETINYVYDELNHLIRVEYGDGTKVVYTYDQVGNRSQVYVGKYSLAVNVVGSGTVTKNPDQPIYSAGTSVTLTAVNGSQTFSAWSGDLTGNTNPTTILMNGNKSVTATFAGGWLQGWTYRKAVTLSRASGAVTNYQMRLLVGETAGASGENVDCNGHIQANFDDLRFTTSDGTTPLNYWIESITGTTPNRLATVWIKFDSIGTSETTFYMYYGNSGATAYSNGDNTFTFFDDFQGSSLDTTTKWNVIYQTGSSTITVSGGILSLKAIVGGSSGWTYCWIRQKSPFTRPYAVNVRWREPDPSSAWAAFNPIHGIVNGGEQIGFEREANSYRHWRKYIGGVSTYILTESWPTDSAWHLHEFLFTTTDFTAKLDGTVKVNNHAQSTPASGTADLKAVDYYAGNTHESQFDYIFVRNYNSPEPAWGSWGNEEVTIIDTTSPTTTALPAGGTYNSAQSVTLTCTDGSGFGCDKTYYTTDGTTPTTSSPVYSSSLNISVTTTLRFFSTDLASNSETAKTEIYIIDTTPPTGTVTINSGAGSTSSTNVTLTLSCSDAQGCSQMQFSNDNVTYSTPEAFTATKAWTLTTGDGTKTVYVKFKDTPGNWSTAYSGTILLDTTPPTTTASPAGGTYNSAQSVALTCNDGTGSGCDKIYYTTDGSIPTTSSPVYSSPINISVTTTLKFFARDLAGNSETVKAETYTISTNMVTVQLKDSTGNPLSGGVVQYYSGGWQTFGTTDATGRATKELQPGTYTFSMTYAFARQEKSQNVATNPTVVFQTINARVQLKDSTGMLMDTGTVQYYSGGWRDIGSTSGGQVSKELLPGNYTFSMNYAFARQEKAQNIASNPTVVFQTIRATVQLKDSTGTLMDTGTVQYYSGGWRDIGSTSGGQVSKELLPGTYTFSMNYAFARQEKAQNVATNPVVVFQTINATVQLKDSTDALMDTGTVQYYSGGWRDIGSTSGGQVSKELLPGTYTFSMNYAFARQEKAQNVATNPTVVFQTINATVQLKDSTGTLMDTGTVQYYSGGWRNIGSTSGGQVSKELLPGSYTFSMNYAYARQEKAQNIASNPTVVFQTIRATVQLKDSTGALMDTGTVQYYSGGWRDIGSTSGGQVSKELLPGSYTFSMNYGFARQEKAQNVATNPVVVFQTINATVQLKDSTGALMDTGTVQYYSGGWRDIGSTSGGQVTKELLSGTYTFSMNYAYARQEKSQNIAADPTVVFNTGRVHSDSSTCTQYYAGGWRVFTQDMELLPVTYTFRFNDTTPDTSYTIISGTGNHIH